MHPTIPAWLVHLCLRQDGTADHTVWQALGSTLSLDDALALKEIAEVGQSWQHASATNSAALADLERKLERK